MDMKKISEEASFMITYLQGRELKPDEKIAVLRSTASIIEHVLSAEMISVMMGTSLNKSKKVRKIHYENFL